MGMMSKSTMIRSILVLEENRVTRGGLILPGMEGCQKMKIRIAVLVSGRGSNLLSLIQQANQPESSFEIICVISNRTGAGAVDHAQKALIPTQVIDEKDPRQFAMRVDPLLSDAGIDLIVLAGFMRILDAAFVERWANRIINIHPSLLPDFPGLHPHRQALQAGVTYSGCTVHYVIPEVDAGPIIAQAVVDVHKDDTEHSLAARILELEHQLYPLVIDTLSRALLKQREASDTSG